MKRNHFYDFLLLASMTIALLGFTAFNWSRETGHDVVVLFKCNETTAICDGVIE